MIVSGSGKEPLLKEDVVKIIDDIPELDEFKATDSSLFLFSVSTGARGVSCSSIRLEDILSYD